MGFRGFFSGKPPMNFGIDVSHHNGNINWRMVAENNIPKVDFAILKSSEGSTAADKKFFTNVMGCEDNRIPWSAYHFATWNDEDEERDARMEARFFVSLVNGAGRRPKLPLVLDIESNKPIPYTKAEMMVYVKTFVDEVLEAGYEIAIYASPGFLQSYFPANHPFTNLKLWVADYSGPVNPVPGWKQIWLHQYTDKGKINGIESACDLNRIVA